MTPIYQQQYWLWAKSLRWRTRHGRKDGQITENVQILVWPVHRTFARQLLDRVTSIFSILGRLVCKRDLGLKNVRLPFSFWPHMDVAVLVKITDRGDSDLMLAF